MLDVKGCLTALNEELEMINFKTTIYICGGAELILLGYENRFTSDIDAIMDSMDSDLVICINKVNKKLNLSGFWLNNQVAPIGKKLGRGWKKNTTLLFSKSHLKIKGLSRQDLISTKLSALIGRNTPRDEEDILWIKPTKQELKVAREYVLKFNTDPIAKVVIDAFIKDYLNE